MAAHVNGVMNLSSGEKTGIGFQVVEGLGCTGPGAEVGGR